MSPDDSNNNVTDANRFNIETHKNSRTDNSRVDEFATWPQFDEVDIAAVEQVLRSGQVNYWTGTHGRNFEIEFARYIGSEHCVAVANGTVALEVALRSLGIGSGDEVIVSPRSYIASASSILLSGARPVFVDVDPTTQNFHVDTIERAITPKTAAIMCVHLGGWPCEMAAICGLATAHNLAVIEDSAQAHGASIEGRKVGSFGNIAAFSFCQDKIISTAGEGGAICTNSEALWNNCWSFKDHGKQFASLGDSLASSTYRLRHDDIGTNLRMTEMQAAVGRRQISKLDDWLAIRRQYAESYNTAFAALPIARTTIPEKHTGHAYYQYYFFVRGSVLKSSWNRDRIVSAASALGLPCGTGTCPELYREKMLADRGLAPAKPLAVAHELGETSITLPVHPGLSANQVSRIIQGMVAILKQATVQR